MKTSSKAKNTDDLEYILDHGIDVHGRKINIFSTITDDLSCRVITALQLMIKQSIDKPIDIYINSEGGEVYAGFAMYDYIKSLQNTEVNTHILGTAMSMATIIFLAGDNRYVYSESTLMLHSVSSMASGKVFLELEDETEQCKRYYKRMCRIYEKYSTKPYSYWYNALKYKDKYLDAETAVRLKIADKIL